MKKAILFFALLWSVSAFSETGYNIKLTLKPYTNAKVYLGYYYGKLKAVADSAMLDGNSTCTFKGTQSLPGGIYFIVSPKKEILFELLLDKEQHFSILADSTTLPRVAFNGSTDNNMFQSYTAFME